MDKAAKLLLWGVFTVVFGTAPLIVRYLNSRMDRQPIPFTDTLKNGDLFIVGAVLAADALGKLFGHGHQEQNPSTNALQQIKRFSKIICFSACAMLLVAASVEFAQVSGRIDAKMDYNARTVIHDSLVVFWFTVAAGIGVILVVEERWNPLSRFPSLLELPPWLLV